MIQVAVLTNVDSSKSYRVFIECPNIGRYVCSQPQAKMSREIYVSLLRKSIYTVVHGNIPFPVRKAIRKLCSAEKDKTFMRRNENMYTQVYTYNNIDM